MFKLGSFHLTGQWLFDGHPHVPVETLSCGKYDHVICALATDILVQQTTGKCDHILCAPTTDILDRFSQQRVLKLYDRQPVSVTMSLTTDRIDCSHCPIRVKVSWLIGSLRIERVLQLSDH